MRAALQPSRSGAVCAREKLCVFTRYPEPGRTKTRLIPALGAESAACLQHAMTAHVLAAATTVATARKTDVEVRFEGGDEARMRAFFGAAFRYQPQGGGDLGERMWRCAREGRESGAESVVLVGSDIPGVDADILTKAFDVLRSHDLVIGPATDGGYYLVGLRREVPELFADMPWGTEHVLRRTLQMPYGDQALFMKTETFKAIGGFPELPIMEDFEMVRRLKRRGRICIVHAHAITSTRRWKKRGILAKNI